MELKFFTVGNNTLLHAVVMVRDCEGNSYSAGTHCMAMIQDCKHSAWEYEMIFMFPQHGTKLNREIQFNSDFRPYDSHPYVEYKYDINCSADLAELKLFLSREVEPAFIVACYEMIQNHNEMITASEREE